MNLPNFNKCRAVAIDLDRTLIDSKSNLSLRNRNLLYACIDKEFPIVIATSRAERSLCHLLGNALADKLSW